MDKEELNLAQNYVNEMEQQIAQLPPSQQSVIFRKCAINCVSHGVLPFLKARYEKCEGNMDSFFSEQEDSEYSFQRVIEPGRIYEMGYPKCLCFMYNMGFTKSEVHCECSRQSILFVLHELFPDNDFEVKTIGTVLGGFDKCTFRITVKNKK
ncbi:MAG: hypothetical protein LKF48_04180 [Prevotella sp.]|jgi:hypothetical protein|nr:hypothetical protein [Prevotella sp.]MCH4182351.1 hypothetical protein [Prevotella sp.]MCH4212490.1 hypothetical protein [Prevotella sp.]MCH4240721.1 hypothetical protein [Prevotella sp.]